MSKIERRVSDFIARHGLLSPHGLHLVAVSGGADSVCLLLLLRKLGYRVEAVHCNFNLRGDESQRDEDFVAHLCQRLDTPLHRAHFDTRAYAQLHKQSIELAARNLRYSYFQQLRRDLGADTVCVAHHQDDSVETILLNIIRGTGLHGLQGISPCRPLAPDDEGLLVRPLLCLRRSDIEAWLGEQGQAYVTDSTNEQPDAATRNRVRLQLMPLLRELNPAVDNALLRLARHAAEAETALQSVLPPSLSTPSSSDEQPSQTSIDIDELLRHPAPQLFLQSWLRPYGFTPATIQQLSERLDDTPTGRRWLSATHQVLFDRHRLLLTPLAEERPTLRMPEPGLYRYSDSESFRVTQVEGAHIDRSPLMACLDANRVAFPLVLRPIAASDRFHPLGMKGSRLVSDFLTDRKCSLADKQRQLVVTQADGTILWVVGLRTDHRFRVTEQTQRTLVVTMDK